MVENHMHALLGRLTVPQGGPWTPADTVRLQLSIGKHREDDPVNSQLRKHARITLLVLLPISRLSFDMLFIVLISDTVSKRLNSCHSDAEEGCALTIAAL
jgi:hypothetical protein